MAQTYRIEFKEEACKRVQSGVPAAQVARELGIHVNTLYTWMSRFKEHPTEPFVGSGNLHPEDAELRALKKRIKDLEEENEFLKKASATAGGIAFFAKMAQWLQVSKSGYYAWRKRPKSPRCTENESLLKEIIQIHEASRGIYGGRKITHEINRKSEKPVNHKRVERIMRENGIRSKSHKKYKATTDSRHSLPMAENILNRNFTADRPGQKMVSDITYIPTDEGWLYLAGVMDFCGDKIVGTAMDGRMTKELVISALKDAIRHTETTEGCILHSDRGSQYCSLDYQELAKEHGFISSMSREGNCWDNAPMESFWGKLKQEWLNEQHFQPGRKPRAQYLSTYGYFITEDGSMKQTSI